MVALIQLSCIVFGGLSSHTAFSTTTSSNKVKRAGQQRLVTFHASHTNKALLRISGNALASFLWLDSEEDVSLPPPDTAARGQGQVDREHGSTNGRPRLRCFPRGTPGHLQVRFANLRKGNSTLLWRVGAGTDENVHERLGRSRQAVRKPACFRLP